MYSGKCFNICFHEQKFFEIFVTKGDTIFIKKTPSFLKVMALIFYCKSMFQRNKNRYISLTLNNKEATKLP